MKLSNNIKLSDDLNANDESALSGWKQALTKGLTTMPMHITTMSMQSHLETNTYKECQCQCMSFPSLLAQGITSKRSSKKSLDMLLSVWTIRVRVKMVLFADGDILGIIFCAVSHIPDTLSNAGL